MPAEVEVDRWRTAIRKERLSVRKITRTGKAGGAAMSNHPGGGSGRKTDSTEKPKTKTQDEIGREMDDNRRTKGGPDLRRIKQPPEPIKEQPK